MSDELFSARALDVRDVGEHILRLLLGLPNKDLACINEPSIVIAQDLKPSDTANLDPQMVFVLQPRPEDVPRIPASWRTPGLPAIVRLGEQLLTAVCDGDELVLSGLD